MKGQIFNNVKIICILVVFLSNCNHENKKDKIDSLLKDAVSYWSNNDYKNSQIKLDSIFRIDSSNVDAFYLLAKIKSKTNRTEEAINTFNILLRKGYKSDTLHNAIAIAYFNDAKHKEYQLQNEEEALKSYENAINFANLALKNNPYYYDASETKVRSLHNLGRYSQSIILLNDFIKYYPDSTSLILLRGIERGYLGDLEGALSDLNNSINSKKLHREELALAYRFRGSFLDDMNESQKAMNDLTKSISYDSASYMSFYNRAVIFEKLGIKDKACQDFRKAAELGMISAYEDIKRICN